MADIRFVDRRYEQYLEDGILSALHKSNSEYKDLDQLLMGAVSFLLRSGNMIKGSLDGIIQGRQYIKGTGSDSETTLDGDLDLDLRDFSDQFIATNSPAQVRLPPAIMDQIAMLTESFGIELLNHPMGSPPTIPNINLNTIQGKYVLHWDMLDGSGNLSGNNGPNLMSYWGLSFGLIDPNGKAIMGGVYDVMRSRMFTGINAIPSFCNDKQIIPAGGSPSEYTPLETRMIITNSSKSQPKGYKFDEMAKAVYKKLADIGYNVRTLHNVSTVHAGMIPTRIIPTGGNGELDNKVYGVTQTLSPSAGLRLGCCNTQDHAGATVIAENVTDKKGYKPLKICNWDDKPVRWNADTLLGYMKKNTAGLDKPVLVSPEGVLIAYKTIAPDLISAVKTEYQKNGIREEVIKAFKQYNPNSPHVKTLIDQQAQISGSRSYTNGN